MLHTSASDVITSMPYSICAGCIIDFGELVLQCECKYSDHVRDLVADRPLRYFLSFLNITTFDVF